MAYVDLLRAKKTSLAIDALIAADRNRVEAIRLLRDYEGWSIGTAMREVDFVIDSGLLETHAKKEA